MPCATIHDSSAFDTNSGPLSERRKAGAPRALTRRDSTSITRGGADAAVDVDRQALLGELVGHRQALELLPVGAMVEHEVVGPHLVRPGRRLRPRPARRRALARPLARHLQPGGPPQPIGPPGSSSDDRRGRGRCGCAGSRSADTARAELAHPRQHRRVLRGFARSIVPAPSAPLRAACRPAAATGPGPSHTPPACAASRHAHQFFAAISFITSISRSRSATSFFSRAFSPSSCLQPPARRSPANVAEPLAPRVDRLLAHRRAAWQPPPRWIAIRLPEGSQPSALP